MHIERLVVQNFRAISNLSVKFSSGANVLVGPNAVGKTTLLEAIRLNKALLAPRTQQENRNVMIQLGAISQHFQQALNFAAIAGDPKQSVVINCQYKLSTDEISMLPSLTNAMARGIAAAQIGIQPTDNAQTQIIRYFSSPAGQQALSVAQQFVQGKVAETARSSECNLNLTVLPGSAEFKGDDLFAQLLFSTVEGQLSPYKSLFSYFPADRAMPSGDVPIQIGSIDAQQQFESHNSNPALKFQRMKSSIFSSFVESEDSREKQQQTFKLIFSELLKEREIERFSVNQFGQATIDIRDTRSSRIFDIDSLSSGEKGLILTFLIISKSLSSGGLVLLDEPEMHLNPAVQKDLLPFMVRHYLRPMGLQAILCTHSPEILSAAIREESCAVHHMRQGGAISPIRKQDQPEIAIALKLLGTSEIEEMLYDAVVFVEGPDDVELLEAAFSAWLSRVKFRELFGRAEVEKHIRRLQEAERAGKKENISYFLFDHDGKPTNIESTSKVVVKQWDRYCLENYLIEPEVLFDLLRREFSNAKTPTSLGEAMERFSTIAKKQLQELVVKEVYGQMSCDNPGMRKEDRSKETFEATAESLIARLEKIKLGLAELSPENWKGEFVRRCNSSLQERELEWSTSWRSKCNGKQFIMDLYAECGITVPPTVLKRRLLQENKFYNGGNGTES